ncbi:uncharacterized protein LOC134252711 [Saccostrea cucullata]|uniref:uncharacterized protein LOC134252711 n=1 Tax=Saccostrea cuccullata TaxID=36930 RepID=UPI002ED21834
MMYRAVLQKSIKVPGGRRRRHISHVSTDRVWISDSEGNLILTNTKGKELDRVTDIGSGYGGHTVNRECDLIYIDREKNINKLSSENKEKTTIKQYNTAPWRPQCVYSSPSTGDLLVGMYRRDAETGKILRYNSTGENIQTIQNDNTGQELYKEPNYITENHNGDIIVSDWYRLAVVVTDRDGRYRFSYTGPPSGSRLRPLGICTDALSHILVCDFITRSVQMLDSKGNYLTEIQSQQHGIDRPYGLSYNDDDTHLLWVGSWNNNTVNIYRVVDTDSLTGLPLENVICNRHPRGACSKFCMQCEVPLCEECVTSTDHGRHNIKDVEMMFNAIHKKKDLDAVLKCLLLCHSCKINLNEEQWKKKFYTVAKFSKFKKIKKESILVSLDEYEPILQQKDYEVMFSCELFRHTSFLRFARDPQFVDIFLTWADKDNIAEYCRSWAYPKKENEVFCWLSPQQTERLIEKLGKDIFTHPTWQDTSIHDAAFSKFGIPMQVIMRGENSVKVFIENLKKGERTMYHTSGMIIGCAGSGKTTLLERLKGISVKKVKKYVKSTRGIELQSDIFDVSDTIKVKLSNRKQRFKVKIDEITRHRKVPETPLNADRKTLDINEQKDKKISGTEQFNRNEATVFTKTEEYENVVKGLESLGILPVLKHVSPDIEKKITMVDFAGQCSYYASHQIFLSPRAFFILVLNMEKKFDDKVGEEVCCQEGSIYKGWTHRGLRLLYT